MYDTTNDVDFRTSGILPDEAVAALGLSATCTARTLWERKTGRLPEPPPPPLRTWPQAIEDAVLADVSRSMGEPLRRGGAIRRSKEFPFILGAPSHRVMGTRRAVHIAHRLLGLSAFDGDLGLPMAAFMEGLHILAVGFEQVDIPIIAQGAEITIFSLRRDACQHTLTDLITRERVFWEHVATDTPPPATMEV